MIVSRNVPVSVFIERQREAFKAALDSLTTTNSTRLSQAVEVHGRLLNLKSKRLVKAANVLVRKDLDDFGAAWEKYSNRPYNVMEEIVELLRSGFGTRNNRVLDRINVAGKQICDKMVIPPHVINGLIQCPYPFLFANAALYNVPDELQGRSGLQRECLCDTRPVRLIYCTHLLRSV